MNSWHRAKPKTRIAAFSLLGAGIPASSWAQAQEEGWPVEIQVPAAQIIIYQPQPETFKGTTLTARAAVSVTLTGKDEPVFGAAWFTAGITTDRDSRTAEISNVEVLRVRFPNITSEQEKQFAEIVEREWESRTLTVSLDRLLTSLENAERETVESKNLQATPPKILFVSYPALLVMLDGEPILRTVEDSSLMRVVNTPFVLVLDPGTKSYYLRGEDIWFQASDLEGPWNVTTRLPTSVGELVSPDEAGGDSLTSTLSEAEIPRVIIATEPTELIVSTGEPAYSPITGSELLYMSNTPSDVFLEIATQQYYLLLSGRWFRSDSLEGPWTFVPADGLPASFSAIPPGSPRGSVLAQVGGTVEAQDAVLDAQIPQTSAISRQDTKLEVTYDGSPKFEAIPGTDIEYATNSPQSVLKVRNRYYACDQAVWFVSNSPTGPWEVSDHHPPEMEQIPPESPVYNTKYVYVYHSTPQVVYVGYTPGYVGGYVWGPTVVYGTGFYYPPYVGPYYYYPRPVTWGFRVHYNPYTGWSFGIGVSNGRFSFGMSWGRGWPPRGGWWGGGGYRHTNININRPININTGDININRNRVQNNIYNKRENINRNVDRSRLPGSRESPARQDRGNRSQEAARILQDRPNNVYADRDGNVFKREQNGWQRREGNTWQQDRSIPTQRPTDRSPSSMDRSRTQQRPSTTPSVNQRSSPNRSAQQRPSTSNRSGLERSHQSRQRGATRTQNYNRSRGGGGARRR